MITRCRKTVHSSTQSLVGIVVVGVTCLPTVGCEDRPYDGLYVQCRGTEHDLYAYERKKGCASGSRTPACYVKTDSFTLCIGSHDFGGTGGTGDIDLDNWPNDTDSLDAIRLLCENKCKNLQDDRAADGYAENCEPEPGEHWEVRNFQGIATPDPLGAIRNPAYLGCWFNEGLAGAPQRTTVVPAGASPVWPSDSTRALGIACADYGGCAPHFGTSALPSLTFTDSGKDWGDNEGRADYVATSAAASSTILSLHINNSVSGPSSDTHEAVGRVEYSLSDCGDDECPLYIANISLENSFDSWNLYSEDEGYAVAVSNVRIRLRRAALGVWNTSTDEIYIGKGRLDLHVEADVAVGSAPPVTVAMVATNDSAVFGELGSGGELSLLNLRASSGSLAMDADLDCNTLSGSPPTADHGLGPSVSAPSTAGLPISSIEDLSSDPDGDLDYKLWIVDGTERGTDYVIPVGLHTVRLEVEDRRYALDVHESRVMVTYP